jgi:hypothetical protein
MILFGLGGWGLKIYHRHHEIIDFFNEPEDLAWAKGYIDKKINFCDAPWQETVAHKTAGEDQYFSPSGRFRIRSYSNLEYEESFDLIDSKVDKTLLTFSFGFNFKPARLGLSGVKWAKNEKFVIFRRPISIDDDWATSEIFVGKTRTGKTIYLGDSAFYDCILRTW